MATDGGNYQLRFDPFLIQLVRVVDSNQNQRCLEVISPTMPINELNRRQLDAEGNPQGPLGRMMRDLDVRRLEELSPMIRPGRDGAPRSPSAVQVVSVPDRRLSEVPVAVVIPRAGQTPEAEDPLSFCRGRIASFKIPRRYFLVDEFPMTSSGKVQRFRLRERAADRMQKECARSSD